jgi:hypothetical protein
MPTHHRFHVVRTRDDGPREAHHFRFPHDAAEAKKYFDERIRDGGAPDHLRTEPMTATLEPIVIVEWESFVGWLADRDAKKRDDLVESAKRKLTQQELDALAASFKSEG